MKRIEEIHKNLPTTHLVMHGSSSVPQELQDIINQYGGKMKPTFGVPVEEIQKGIQHGVRKINVDTDNRMAMTGAIRKVFIEKPDREICKFLISIVPPSPLPPGRRSRISTLMASGKVT